jgi:DNA-binding HxlR family transcriptional regulator
MLNQALRELEEDGLIVRNAFIEVPPRVEYSLTDSGREILPFIDLLSGWAKKQMIAKGIPYIIKNA